MKNQPYMYHNGGLWPMVNGFYVLGLTRSGQQERARHLLAAINAANAQSNAWTFPEYLHGQTHAPMGTPYLAWSAAAGVLAHQAVVHGITPLALL
jgi:glycogen debranching enzyme